MVGGWEDAIGGKGETMDMYLEVRVCFMDLGPGSEVTREWEAWPGVRAAANARAAPQEAPWLQCGGGQPRKRRGNQ